MAGTFAENDSIKSKAYNGRVRFLVLHYTSETFENSVELLTDKVSSHYIVPDFNEPDYIKKFGDQPQIFKLVDENDRAWHAGISAWENRTALNDTSIGIEVVNNASWDPVTKTLSFPPYPDNQVAQVIALVQGVLGRHPDITATRVLGHSDIAPGRKTDPGPMFPWKKLYDAGCGAWYDEDLKQHYVQTIARAGMPSYQEIQKQFRRYGYAIEPTGILDEQTQKVAAAFQMHFRPSNFDGKLDAETVAILYALVKKYFN